MYLRIYGGTFVRVSRTQNDIFTAYKFPTLSHCPHISAARQVHSIRARARQSTCIQPSHHISYEHKLSTRADTRCAVVIRVIRAIYHVQILIRRRHRQITILINVRLYARLKFTLALLFFSPSFHFFFFSIGFRSRIHPSNQPSIHLSTYISFFSSLVRRQIEKFRNINSPRGQTRITRLPSKPGRWISVLLELLKLSWERFF